MISLYDTYYPTANTVFVVAAILDHLMLIIRPKWDALAVVAVDH